MCLNKLISNSILTLLILLHFHFLLSASNSIIFDSLGKNVSQTLQFSENYDIISDSHSKYRVLQLNKQNISVDK